MRMKRIKHLVVCWDRKTINDRVVMQPDKRLRVFPYNNLCILFLLSHGTNIIDRHLLLHWIALEHPWNMLTPNHTSSAWVTKREANTKLGNITSKKGSLAVLLAARQEEVMALTWRFLAYQRQRLYISFHSIHSANPSRWLILTFSVTIHAQINYSQKNE